MSTIESGVARHYGNSDLIGRIIAGLEAAGKDIDRLTIDDIAAIDEFHIGGRTATQFVLDSMNLKAGQQVLDVGCGIGGPARVAASLSDCNVTGIDLVADYIEAAQSLNDLTGLAKKVSCQVGNALDMPFDDAAFDAAFSIHVAMNIKDREGLYGEIARVLKPGAVFCAYDVMKTGDGDLAYPVPWAGGPEVSFLVTPDEMKDLLDQAGFEVEMTAPKADFALGFFDNLQAKKKAMPKGMSIHLVMGPDANDKVANTRANIANGLIAPVHMVARKKA